MAKWASGRPWVGICQTLRALRPLGTEYLRQQPFQEVVFSHSGILSLYNRLFAGALFFAAMISIRLTPFPARKSAS